MTPSEIEGASCFACFIRSPGLSVDCSIDPIKLWLPNIFWPLWLRFAKLKTEVAFRE